MKMKRHIGVLALQGDFAEHVSMIEKCGAKASEIRHSRELKDIDGLIIPGGESTAIATLTSDNEDPIFSNIRERGLAGMPIYGTCMGSIFLAKEIQGSNQGRLSLMDISIKRNAFGPQRFSFETELSIAQLGQEPFKAVFIRGPVISSVGPGVEVLAKIEQGVVMARQDHYLVTAFHPEITNDLRIHMLFMAMVEESRIGMRIAESAASLDGIITKSEYFYESTLKQPAFTI
jgi:5'-phosphate synthase pdxT subunit